VVGARSVRRESTVLVWYSSAQTLADGVLQFPALAHLGRDEVGEYLTVRFGREDHALFDELRPQMLGVLQDPVVHHRDPAGLVDMRMCVRLGGRAVRRPAGVRDPDDGAFEPLGQRAELAHPHRGLADGQVPITLDGDSRRVVSPVFQPAQTLQQHRNRVPMADVTHDSTHFGVLSGLIRR
jgi:hypothetical protein